MGLLDRHEDGFHPAGILMAQVDERDVEILWIYVEPELRFQGAGTRLLRSLISILKREKQEAHWRHFWTPEASMCISSYQTTSTS